MCIMSSSLFFLKLFLLRLEVEKNNVVQKCCVVQVPCCVVQMLCFALPSRNAAVLSVAGFTETFELEQSATFLFLFLLSQLSVVS